jgi:hypothetical protein
MAQDALQDFHRQVLDGGGRFRASLKGPSGFASCNQLKTEQACARAFKGGSCIDERVRIDN